MKLATIVVILTTLAGCATTPANTCGDRPKQLVNYINGDEWMKRAHAWESYAMCLEDIVGPQAPVEVDPGPLVIPDMRTPRKPNPWDELRKPSEGSGRLARRDIAKPAIPVGKGPQVPTFTTCPSIVPLRFRTLCAARFI